MSAEKSEIDMGQWFSTYGVITAERILGKYQIKLAPGELSTAMKNSFGFYRKVLTVPLKNVLNGIILQQANDYYVYVQKLFIDYLLSGENSKDEDAQGAMTRESIENERKQLLTLGEEFNLKEEEHNMIIAESQACLINMGKEFNQAFEKGITQVSATLNNAYDKNTVRQAINHALIYCDLTMPQLQSNQFLFTEKMTEVLKNTFNEEMKARIMHDLTDLINIVLTLDDKMHSFVEQTAAMNIDANSFRDQFHDAALRVLEQLKFLPEYRIDPVQDASNREVLHFDRSIGALG